MPARLYQRRPDVDAREVDSELFLLDRETARIHHLNATGAAVWRLVADPIPLSEIVRVFCEAFPELTPRVHKKRLKSILDELDENELLLSEPNEPRPSGAPPQ